MAFWYPPQQNPGIRPQLGPPTMAGAPGGNMQFQPGGPQLGGIPPQLMALFQQLQAQQGGGPQLGPGGQMGVAPGMPPFLSAPTGPGGDPLANAPTGDMTVSG